MQPREHQRYNIRDGLTQPHKGAATDNTNNQRAAEGGDNPSAPYFKSANAMKQEESKYTALSLRREVAEVLELLRRLSTQTYIYTCLVDKAKPGDQVNITYASEIYESAERIKAAVRTVEKFLHLIEIVQDQEEDLRKLYNRLAKILLNAHAEYRKLIE